MVQATPTTPGSSASNRVLKPHSQKGKRILEQRAPKLIENPKSALYIRGAKTNNATTSLLKDLYDLHKPHGTLLKRKNPEHPFEDDTFFERFTAKYDTSMFVFVSNSKKRPNNLVIGRMYDFHVLDMVEFGVENFKDMDSFKNLKVPIGTKPVLTFAGEPFETDPTYQRIKNLFVDYFRLEDAEQLCLQGVKLAISFTAAHNMIHMRVYRIQLKKSGSSTPRAELDEIGPRCDLRMRRNVLASDDLFKLALKQPAAIKPKSVKNVKKDVFGSKLGRVHVGKQDISKLQTRKMAALKKGKRRSK